MDVDGASAITNALSAEVNEWNKWKVPNSITPPRERARLPVLLPAMVSAFSPPVWVVSPQSVSRPPSTLHPTTARGYFMTPSECSTDCQACQIGLKTEQIDHDMQR